MATSQNADEIIIAVDPHKASWTAAVVDHRHHVLASDRFPTSDDGYRRLIAMTGRWPSAVWAIEGANGLGQPLTRRLLASGHKVVDVPAKLSARVRVLSGGHGRKNDDTDALATAIAALTARALKAMRINEPAEEMRLLSEHRDDLVKSRTQIINRLHVLLTHLVAGGVQQALSAQLAADTLRTVRPTNAPARTRKTIAAELVVDIRRLDQKIKRCDATLRQLVDASGSTLTQIYGIATILAARTPGRVGDIRRLPTAGHFAAHSRVAPIEVSSGDVVRHRLSRAGDRKLNQALHQIALTQVPHDTPGRAHYLRKRGTGKSHLEAMRCPKRRLADTVYRQLVHDANQSKTGPGGQLGGDSTIQRGQPNPNS